MRPMKLFSLAFVLVLLGGMMQRPAAAAVTNPSPNQVFAFGTTSVDLGWDPVLGATTYKLKLLFNDTLFDSQDGIAGTSVALANTYMPGYYTVLVRGVSGANNGPWSAPVTFIVQRNMTPCGNTVFLKSPPVFKWTRSPTAARYLLKLAKYDKKTGKYIVKQTVWIPQPASGLPNWRPPANSISNGKYRWSLTDYSDVKPGLTSMAYFQVNMVLGSDYLVVDLSGGPAAGSYPVTHLTDVPAGGWTDVYKTTKLVMRKVPAWTFTMGSPTNELGWTGNETPHQVTLTKAFYIGVFEVTQKQWELVMGNKPSHFNNSAYYGSRPVELVSYYDIRENPANVNDPVVDWPSNSAVNAASFMGKLRAKTGLTTFDLPTEAQWEYACRAGTTTALNSGKNLTSISNCPNMAEVGRFYFNGGNGFARNGDTSLGTAKAGSYLPNAWGLYDMHGNVWEWCLDWYGPYPGTVIDPVGVALWSTRVFRGGGWNSYADYCRSAIRLNYAEPFYQRDNIGFRAARTLP